MEAADEQLMLAYRDGDATAFDALYARYRVRLFGFVLRSVRERAQAEELFQDIWMRVIDARERYVPTARFSTWLYAIAHHRLVDHWRRRGLATVPIDDRDDDARVEPVDPPADPSYDPARRAEVGERMARLRAALEALPPAQREVFLLREEAGLTVPEIAQVTGAAAEAVKSRLRYALARLREAIGDD